MSNFFLLLDVRLIKSDSADSRFVRATCGSCDHTQVISYTYVPLIVRTPLLLTDSSGSSYERSVFGNRFDFGSRMDTNTHSDKNYGCSCCTIVSRVFVSVA